MRYVPQERRTYFGEMWELWGLQIKLKVIIGFYMIATKLDTVYGVELPPTVKALFDQFAVIVSLGFLELSATPLDCAGLAGYDKEVIFWFVLPLCICGVIYLFFQIRPLVMRNHKARGGYARGSRRGPSSKRNDVSAIFQALPYMLKVLFLIYPIVNTVAFQAFPVYTFGCTVTEDGELVDCTQAYLVTDVSVEKSTEKYNLVLAWAIASIAVYPVGLLVMNTVMLYLSRKSIDGTEPHTPLSRAILFLYKDFHPLAYWWEVMEMLRRFVLVGVFGIWPMEPHTIQQLVVATLFCLVYLILQLQVQPYATVVDNFLAQASSGALAIVFFVATTWKAASLLEDEDVIAFLPPSLKNIFKVDSVLVTYVLMAAGVTTISLMVIMMIQQTHADRLRRAKEARNMKARRLKYVKNNHEVELPKISYNEYHIFLSHVWGTGQDNMRIVKSRLLEMIPDTQCFLDVDDLEDISHLEGYIDRSHIILIYCSQGYFQSRNCMREIRSSVMKNKRLMCIMDADKSRGGLADYEIKEQLIAADDQYTKWGFFPEKLKSEGGDRNTETDPPGPRGATLYAKLFAEIPIYWERLGVFQDVSMRLIAERILPETHDDVYMARELATQISTIEIAIPRNECKYHLYISPYNPGAIEFINEVNEAFGAKQGWSDGVSDIKYTTDLGELHEAERMFCYLTAKTWRGGERSAQFANEVRMAMMVGDQSNTSGIPIPVLLAHEMLGAGGQEARYGCDFGTFFGHPDGQTPGDLLKANIYGTIAVALKGGPWRSVSMVLVANAISARITDDDVPGVDPSITDKKAKKDRKSNAISPTKKGMGVEPLIELAPIGPMEVMATPAPASSVATATASASATILTSDEAFSC